MSFAMTEEQRMAVDGLRRFLDEKIEPEFIAHGDGFIPRGKMQKWMQGLAEFGLINAPHSDEWGGLGMDWVTHLRLLEELAVSSMDIGVPVVINTVGADLLANAAPQHLKEKYLPGLLSGELFISMGISEPDVGSDVAAVKTRAVRDGDDWVINGEKTWISNGEYSDIFVCTCKTAEGELTHILIDREEHGYEVRGIPKIALNGQSTAQIFLSDVRVPVSNTIGEVGAGQNAYAASKSGVLGLHMPAARELGSLGIRVNAICPGLFGTPMVNSLGPKVVESLVSMVEAPKRTGHMDEFAHCCAVLVENG